MIAQLNIQIVLLAELEIDTPVLFIIEAEIIRILELILIEMRGRVLSVITKVADIKFLERLPGIQAQFFVSLELGLTEFDLLF